MSLSIRIGDSADPDTGEACKTLFINEVEIPFWPSPDVVEKYATQAEENPNGREAILNLFKNQFVSIVSKCINRRLTLTDIIESLEVGRITAGPPPENQ